MMTAHDSSPGPDPIAPETLENLRAALATYVETQSDGETLHSALHELAAEARSKSVLPERLLVALKDVWYKLPSVRSMKEADGQARLLQRVVTLCIKEYYA
jgi:hypothetical protein